MGGSKPILVSDMSWAINYSQLKEYGVLVLKSINFFLCDNLSYTGLTFGPGWLDFLGLGTC